uniref:Uncharacterized protein n=1 Tax=Anguilla anguilla TaxID=7936 RepID=A0A0E9WK64_ANGAN
MEGQQRCSQHKLNRDIYLLLSHDLSRPSRRGSSPGSTHRKYIFLSKLKKFIKRFLAPFEITLFPNNYISIF